MQRAPVRDRRERVAVRVHLREVRRPPVTEHPHAEHHEQHRRREEQRRGDDTFEVGPGVFFLAGAGGRFDGRHRRVTRA